MPGKDSFLTVSRILALIVAAALLALPAAAFAERMAVSVPNANVRSGPGTNYRVLWQVEMYHPVDVVERSGDWCRFKDFEGEDAWIFCGLLSNLQTGITKVENCNIRSGPGTGNDVIYTAQAGVPFRIQKKEGRWLYVEFPDGDKGWLHDSLAW
ncbi:MAG: SH3 domain-containing protein [Desulfatibacillaceae bacterium]